MKSTLFILLYLCLLSNVGYAQTKAVCQVNAPFPYRADFIMNGKRTNIDRFYGKPIILEFFASTCIICFQKMAKMNALSEHFKNKVQIVLVGKEDGRIQDVYDRFRQKQNLNLDVVFDSTIHKELKIETVPHFIWIDATGLVRAETGPEVVDSSRVAAFLSGSYKDFKKQIAKVHFNTKKLLKSGSGNQDDTGFLFRSMLTGYIDSLYTYYAPKLEFSRAGPFFQVVNVPLQTLYRYALFNKPYWNYGDSLYGEVNTDVIVNGEADESKRSQLQELYSYSFFVALEKQQGLSLNKALLNDLENNFGYTAQIEVRKMPYWSLTKTNMGLDVLKSTEETTIRQSSYAGIKYKNVKLKELLNILDYNCRSALPFIDETGIAYKVDIQLNAIMTDIEDVRKELLYLGLRLEKREKEMKVIVLRKLDKTVATN